MSFAAKLFSFEGRIGRGDWWTLGVLVLVAQVAVFFLLFQSQGGFGELAPALDASGKPIGDPGPEAGPGGFLWSLVAAAALGVWPNWALGVKRWHDRGKGAVWMLVNFIPWVGPLWATVELGFLGGTPGPNRFGPGPGRTGGMAEVFGDDREDDGGRADAAIARWQAEQRGRSAQAQAQSSSWSAAPATAAPATGGFGKRTSAPIVW